jgi:hypothetical protein
MKVLSTAISLLWASSPVDALSPAASSHLQCGPTQHMVQPTSAAHAEVPAHLLVPTQLRVHHPSLPCCCPLLSSLPPGGTMVPFLQSHSSIPKRHHRSKRLTCQFCQLLKPWTHFLFNLIPCGSSPSSATTYTPILQLQIYIASFKASFLHSETPASCTSCKLLALKHFDQAFVRPRVNQSSFFQTLMSAAYSHPSHDGTQPKAQFNTDNLDFGVDNRCSAKTFQEVSKTFSRHCSRAYLLQLSHTQPDPWSINQDHPT